MLRGQCLCGSVKFEVEDQFLYSGYCHCGECRLAGSGGTPIGGIEKVKFAITSVEDTLASYSKSSASKFYFCSHCGSSVFSEKPEAGLMHVRYGALIDSPSLKPQAHMYVASKADWYELDDELPKFEEAPG